MSSAAENARGCIKLGDFIRFVSYNGSMARGWESKSVEEQQSQLTAPPLTKEEKERLKKAQDAEKARQLQALQLTRARVVEQLERSSNERYNELLNRELAHIDASITELK
jgi:hypothetical protein